jgi:hypothetical protein
LRGCKIIKLLLNILPNAGGMGETAFVLKDHLVAFAEMVSGDLLKPAGLDFGLRAPCTLPNWDLAALKLKL